MKHELHDPKALRYGGHILEPDVRDGDYALVRSAIELISRRWDDQPSLSELAEHLGIGETSHECFVRVARQLPAQW